MKRRWTGIVTLVTAAVGLAACSTSGGSPTASSPGGTPSASASSGTTSATLSTTTGAMSLQADYVQTIHAVLPSVVLIQTSKDLGSGVVFDSKGDIVTNDHVVGSATTFQVTRSGSATPVSAKLVGTYPPDDLAVIRVSNPQGLKPATFAASKTVQVGDIVLAIGNPLGLASSVTNGIASALGRTVSEPTGKGSPGATLPDTIQTSASINPGNSGGALVNLADQVIGIPTLAATDQQIGGSAPGIGFAISATIVKDIATQIVTHGKVIHSHRAAVGVHVTNVSDQNGQPAGVGIVSVQPGGSAEKAGLKAGTIITAINATPTPTTQALASVLANLAPGQHASVKVTPQSGTSHTVQITLGSLPG